MRKTHYCTPLGVYSASEIDITYQSHYFFFIIFIFFLGMLCQFHSDAFTSIANIHFTRAYPRISLSLTKYWHRTWPVLLFYVKCGTETANREKASRNAAATARHWVARACAAEETTTAHTVARRVALHCPFHHISCHIIYIT